MIDREQKAAVVEAFSLAGYDGSLVTATVTSEDERFFLLDSEDFQRLRDVRALEQQLQNLLHRKVGVIERTAIWGNAVPFE